MEAEVVFAIVVAAFIAGTALASIRQMKRNARNMKFRRKLVNRTKHSIERDEYVERAGGSNYE